MLDPESQWDWELGFSDGSMGRKALSVPKPPTEETNTTTQEEAKGCAVPNIGAFRI